MDTFGSIDAYAMIALEGLDFRSTTIKGSYNPKWNETFTLNIAAVENGCSSELAVTVYDWDMLSKSDEVGGFTIPASRMSELVRAKAGWEGQETFTLYNEGKMVVGQDKQASQVTLRVRVEDVPKAFATLELDEKAMGQRRLEVTLLSANHLPKVVPPMTCVEVA
jgi:Ca2+-dependent lipid-binding protein